MQQHQNAQPLMLAQRQKIAQVGRNMHAAGLCRGTSGNLSIFDAQNGLVAISPSGMEYDAVEPEDVVVLRLDGTVAEGRRKPSSEFAMHLAFYRSKPQARAVVHTHSLYCTILACMGEPIRAVHYAIASAGASCVPCAGYETFGTQALADAAVSACGKANAVLLRNHGMICCGASLDKAFRLAENLEFLVQIQWSMLCAGNMQTLSEAQMQAVFERFQTYGQTPGAAQTY